MKANNNRKKIIAFKVIAVLLPFALIFLLELTLRAFGYGNDFSLFVESEKPGYWVMNPDFSEKYFLGTQNATIGNFEPFQQRKDVNTFRVFVLGASTAIGYPYFHNGSFHRWLQYRLQHTFPEKQFEIINLSLTAVNSYTLLDIAKELPEFAPDAVLVYAGHNEYYGAMGVGATGSVGNSPWLIKTVLNLREFRLVQWFTKISLNIRKSFSKPETDLRENLMKRMAAEQEIPYGSTIFQSGIQQFATNLNGILEVFDLHNIPVFISNLVSNEKDLPPFISGSTNTEKAAIHHFQLGKDAYSQGNFTEAKEHFVQAKELDLLRFRAPEAMNDAILQLSGQYDNVHWVDAKTVFERHAPHGIIGNETLLEHVHPNLFGYALLSDAFYEAMRREQMIATEWPPAMSFEKLQTQMPITVVDSLKGAYEVMILKEGWPFNEPMPPEDTATKTLPEALAGGLVVKQISWEAAMEKLYQYYYENNEYEHALKVAEAVMLEHPNEVKFYTTAARLSMRLKKSEKAIRFYARAFELNPSAEYAEKIAIDLIKNHKLKASVPYLDYLSNSGRASQAIRQVAMSVNEILALQNQRESEPDNVQLLNQLALSYARIGQQDTARWLLQKVLHLDPGNEEGTQLLERLN